MSDALLKKAIEIFNYPEEMGEYAHDEVAALQELVASARRDGFPHLADLQVLAEELAASSSITAVATPGSAPPTARRCARSCRSRRPT